MKSPGGFFGTDLVLRGQSWYSSIVLPGKCWMREGRARGSSNVHVEWCLCWRTL